MIKHIRTHVVGYAALCLALVGSAYADQRGLGDDGARSSRLAAQVGCNVGEIRGFARVHGNNGIPQFYTSEAAAIDRVRNCSGGAVQVRRAGTGLYFVRFVSNTSTLAVTTSNGDGEAVNGIHDDNVVSVSKITSGSDAGSFRIEVEDVNGNGTSPQDAQFTIMLM
jgi:hypothetical protein